MEILELINIVKNSPDSPELNNIISNNVKIDKLFMILGSNDATITNFQEKILNKNSDLKQYILKQMNSYIVEKIKTIKASKNEISESDKKIYENYLKYFFEKGIEIDCDNAQGVELIKQIRNQNIGTKTGEKKDTKEFFKDTYKRYIVWDNYVSAITKMVEDINAKDNITENEVMKYDKVFDYYFNSTKLGHNVKEAETVLKLIKNQPNIDINKITSLDTLYIQYGNAKSNPDSTIKNENQIFSILLDYEEQLKENGIDKNLKYSLIEEMNKKIQEGTFGTKNENGENVLSENEFTFALKTIANPKLINEKTSEQLNEILAQDNLQVQIGKREIEKIVSDENILDKFKEISPDFQKEVLVKTDNYIGNMLKNILKSKREITQFEKNIYSNYLKNNFEKSLNERTNDPQMAELFKLMRNMVRTNAGYNPLKMANPKETKEFFRQEYENNHLFDKYTSAIGKKLKEISDGKEISIEEFEKYDKIVGILSFTYNQDSKEFKNILKIIGNKSQELNIQSEVLDNEIEIYIDKISKNAQSNIPELEGTILEYYERQLQNSAKDINNNAAISHLIRAAQKGILPQKDAENVLNLLNERNKDKQIPDMQEFDEKVDNYTNMSNEEHEKFIEQVSEIRLQEGILPEKYSKYIIQQGINFSDRAKDGISERALEDFGEYELSKANINNYLVKVEEQEYLSSYDTLGEHSKYKNTIIISRNNLSKNGLIKALETLLHENTHAEQTRNIKTGELNYNGYIMLKEEQIRYKNPKFYNANYNNMYIEIDARLQGFQKRFQKLKEMGFSFTEGQLFELEVGNIKDKVFKACEEKENAKNKIIDSEKQDINTIFYKTIQENPQMLEENPLLQFEFENVDGNIQRKSYANILKGYEEQLENVQGNTKDTERISNLFYGILLKDNTPMSEEKLQEELKQLLQLSSDNKFVNAFKNKVLETKFPANMLGNNGQEILATMQDMYNNTNPQERKDASTEIAKAMVEQNKDKQTDIDEEKGK